VGAILGLALAAVLGWLLYKGGVRVNLSRFFRATGAVLALVAAGLVASALHSAHEAIWFNVLQAKALDLDGLVAPGSVRAALLTGMLGLRPEPTVGELLGWLLYLVPLALALGMALAACGSNGEEADSGSGTRKVEVALTDAACEPAKLQPAASAVTYDVTYKGGDKVSEFEVMDGDRIIGEVENGRWRPIVREPATSLTIA
jgi:hypothetical protein